MSVLNSYHVSISLLFCVVKQHNCVLCFLFRGQNLKKQHEQRRYEREMQRISLPLSAFSNPTCELIDENTIVITAEHETTPVQEGGDPLMGQHAGTPGAWEEHGFLKLDQNYFHVPISPFRLIEGAQVLEELGSSVSSKD